MRPTTLLALLIPLMLAGCAALPDDATPAATTGNDAAAAAAATATMETALPDASGTFLLAANVPNPTTECPATGTTLDPTPGHGARIDHELPAGTTTLHIEVDNTALTGGIGYSICIFQNGTLTGQASGPAPLETTLAATAGALTILLGPEDVTGAPVNADVQIEWTLRATTTGPA